MFRSHCIYVIGVNFDRQVDERDEYHDRVGSFIEKDINKTYRIVAPESQEAMMRAYIKNKFKFGPVINMTIRFIRTEKLDGFIEDHFLS